MTLFFLFFAFFTAILGFILEGGHMSGLLGPTAFIIVVGGTIGATGVSVPFEDFKKGLKLFIIAIKNQKADMLSYINLFQELSMKARKEGLLALESEINKDNIDPFIKKGITLVVDGADPELIKSVLETDISQTSKRHKSQMSIYESAGGYAPTIGIIGTVMGLVHVLSNLDKPETLGGSIAAAFLATLYGVGTANFIYLPVAAKLKALDAKEVNLKLMMTEAISSIAAGDNPVIMMEKLKTFLPSDQVAKLSDNRG